MTSDLLVGSSKLDITPPLHVPHLGSDPRQGVFEGVHDPLHVRAAVFDAGDSTVAVLNAEVLGLSRDLFGQGCDFIDDVRSVVCESTGLDPESILLAATHAHSTPETYGIIRIWEREDCRAWLEVFADQLASALRLAWRDRRPASIRLGSAELRGMSCNRREAYGGPDAYHPIDESLTVLLAEREGAGPVALANYTCHPVTVQVQPLVSADFPGRACQAVEATLGDGANCLFLEGAAGDINPIRGHTGEWRDVETYGLMLAGGILEAVGSARLAEPCGARGVAAATETLSLPAREAPSVEEASATVVEAETAWAATPEDSPEREPLYGAVRAAREAYRLAQFGTGPIATEVQALRIGDLTLTAFPGELFCELGLRLKGALASPTMVVECANGCLGYLPPEQAWDEGGYEVGLGAWCRLARGAPEQMIQAAQRLAEAL